MELYVRMHEEQLFLTELIYSVIPGQKTMARALDSIDETWCMTECRICRTVGMNDVGTTITLSLYMMTPSDTYSASRYTQYGEIFVLEER